MRVADYQSPYLGPDGGRKKSLEVDLKFIKIDKNRRNLGFQNSVRPNTCRAARGVRLLLFFGGGLQKSQHHAHAGMNRKVPPRLELIELELGTGVPP